MAVTGFLVVANGGAGSTEQTAVGEAVARLATGSPTELRWTDDAHDVDAAIEDLDGRALAVAGGDGSLHLAVARLDAVDRLDDVTVALLPLGTGNDLSRTVGLHDLPAGAGLVDGEELRIDLLRDDRGALVANMAHLGLGVPASRRASGMKGVLGPLAYPLGAALAAVRSGPWDVRVAVDDEVVHDGDVVAVAVANGQTAGGGTRFAPDADPTDGLADVVVFAHGDLAGRAATALALRRGHHLARPDVTWARGRSVSIVGTAAANVDGELEDERDEHRFRVEPGSLRLLVPRRS